MFITPAGVPLPVDNYGIDILFAPAIIYSWVSQQRSVNPCVGAATYKVWRNYNLPR